MRFFDSLIVGAGPAGGMLAYELSRQGLRVLILEKEALPRYKTCGGGLTFKVAALLPFDIGSICETEVDMALVSYRGGQALLARHENIVGWTVRRDRLDYFLLQKALEAGAELAEKTKVISVELSPRRATVQTDKGRFCGEILAGADGAYSLVASALGLRSKKLLAVALSMEAEVSEETLERYRRCVAFDFGAVPKGYAWIFPKKDHLSTGIFSLSRKIKNLRKILLAFLDKNLGDYKKILLRGHLIPLGGGQEVLHKGRALLVGDAAGLADPIWGEGIYYALKSARLAAESIRKALAGGMARLEDYTWEVNAQILSEFRYARRIALFLYNFPGLSYRLFIKNRGVVGHAAELLRGDMSYKKFYAGLLKDVLAGILGR